MLARRRSFPLDSSSFTGPNEKGRELSTIGEAFAYAEKFHSPPGYGLVDRIKEDIASQPLSPAAQKMFDRIQDQTVFVGKDVVIYVPPSEEYPFWNRWHFHGKISDRIQLDGPPDSDVESAWFKAKFGETVAHEILPEVLQKIAIITADLQPVSETQVA